MGQLLLITDDPERSADLGLGAACHVHDLRADAAPGGQPDMLMADVPNLDAANVQRLRRLLAQTRGSAPLVVLLRRDSSHARLQALALGATQTLTAPFDLSRFRCAPSLPETTAAPPPARVGRRAETARQFFGTMFVADRPITPIVADTGTALVARAIQDTGIRDWVSAVRRFDDATHQHCLLVAGLAAMLATSLGLGPRERHRLTKAALLHDVGKIHVPAAILNKPGKLDPAEMALVRRHPAQGEAMLAGQGFEPELLAVVRSHHEMLDGSGYPDGLVGDAIPDLVRLVTVCDIYGALIEHRPYKPPMPAEEAYAILRSMSGRLDPVLVTAFGPVATAFMPSFPCDT